MNISLLVFNVLQLTYILQTRSSIVILFSWWIFGTNTIIEFQGSSQPLIQSTSTSWLIFVTICLYCVYRSQQDDIVQMVRIPIQNKIGGISYDQILPWFVLPTRCTTQGFLQSKTHKQLKCYILIFRKSNDIILFFLSNF